MPELTVRELFKNCSFAARTDVLSAEPWLSPFPARVCVRDANETKCSEGGGRAGVVIPSAETVYS